MSDAKAVAMRVNYEEGQVLTTSDLLDEQSYLISMRQKHAVAPHRWGIVRGLNPTVVSGALQVSPGLAVDKLGRYLIVPDTVRVGLSSVEGDSILVWLAYALDAAGSAPVGQNTRWIESTHLRLEPGTFTDPRQMEDTVTGCPVLLGVLERSSANAPYKVNTNARRLIGLRGETITACSGVAQVRLGPDFAVGLRTQGGDEFNEMLRIDEAGNTVITANSCVKGNVVAQPDAGLASSGGVGVGFGAAIDLPTSASPWQMYRTNVPQKTGPPRNQLNVELLQEDDNNAGGITAAIGRAVEGKFQSCLTVNPSGKITITGVVRVNGLVREGPITADPNDPRFLVNLANAATGNIADTGPGPLAIKVGGDPESKVGDVRYTLTFTNNGSSLVRVLQIQEFLTLDGQLTQGPSNPIAPFHLEAGKTRTIERIVSVQYPGKLAVGVRVLGAALDGSALTAKDAMFIQVSNGSEVVR